MVEYDDIYKYHYKIKGTAKNEINRSNFSTNEFNHRVELEISGGGLDRTRLIRNRGLRTLDHMWT